MAVDPLVLRPFLGHLDAARTHAERVRAAAQSALAPTADVEALAFSARVDASFVEASLRDAARSLAPRDASRGALELADRVNGQLDGLLAGLGASKDPSAQWAGVHRIADRLVRWDLDDVARRLDGAATPQLGAHDELGHWTTLEDRFARDVGAAASVVRSDTDDVMRQLHDFGLESTDAAHHGDDILDSLDREIASGAALRGLDDAVSTDPVEAIGRSLQSLEARAASAFERTAPEVHPMGRPPALPAINHGTIVAGRDELLDVVPGADERVATLVMRGRGGTAELPLVATGRSIRFPTRESATSALAAGSDRGAFILSPEAAGGWRALEVERIAGEAADAITEANVARKLELVAIRGETVPVRGYVLGGTDHPLRHDMVRRPPEGLEGFRGLGAQVTRTTAHIERALPSPTSPLASIEVRTGIRRTPVIAQLSTSSDYAWVIEGSRAEAVAAFHATLRHRFRDPQLAALVRLEPGRYGIVSATGPSVGQVRRALEDGAVPGMLDPRLEALGAWSSRHVRDVDLATGQPITPR